MSNYRTNRNYTLIEELPDLEELERNQPQQSNGFSMIPPDNANQMQKFIRNGYDPPMESGMMPPQQQRPQRQQNQQEQQVTIQQFIPPPPPPQNYMIEDPRMFEPPQMHDHRHHMMDSGELNCINVADHTTNCVVCSRLYQQNNAGYIVVIILLAIICILLLKRVLNV